MSKEQNLVTAVAQNDLEGIKKVLDESPSGFVNEVRTARGGALSYIKLHLKTKLR